VVHFYGRTERVMLGPARSCGTGFQSPGITVMTASCEHQHS
jgi:hypothetical protein